jgi:hypothetical protein
MINVSNAFKSPPSIKYDVPILIDEINYPLVDLFVPLTNDNAYESLENADQHKTKENTDNLAIEINDLNIPGLNVIGYPLGSSIKTTRKDLCQSSLDVRDHFRYYFFNTSLGINQGLITPIEYTGEEKKPSACKKISEGDAQEAISLKNRYNNNILISEVDEIITFKHANTFSSLGNVFVSPPTIDNKFGTIIYGSNIKPANYNLNFSWIPDECPSVAKE